MKDFEHSVPTGAKIRDLGKVFKENIKDCCTKRGINHTYSRIIMLLAKYRDGVIQNEIVDKTYLKKSTISLTLKDMEEEGYITRHNDDLDNRKTIVMITDKGIDLDNKIRECFGIVEDKMVEGISKEELMQFSQMIDKLKSNLEK